MSSAPRARILWATRCDSFGRRAFRVELEHIDGTGTPCGRGSLDVTQVTLSAECPWWAEISAGGGHRPVSVAWTSDSLATMALVLPPVAERYAFETVAALVVTP